MLDGIRVRIVEKIVNKSKKNTWQNHNNMI